MKIFLFIIFLIGAYTSPKTKPQAYHSMIAASKDTVWAVLHDWIAANNLKISSEDPKIGLIKCSSILDTNLVDYGYGCDITENNTEITIIVSSAVGLSMIQFDINSNVKVDCSERWVYGVSKGVLERDCFEFLRQYFLKKDAIKIKKRAEHFCPALSRSCI